MSSAPGPPPPGDTKGRGDSLIHPSDLTIAMRYLHWLPVQFRIHFKILLPPYKVIHNLAPHYLSDLLLHHTSTRRLRSTDTTTLEPLGPSFGPGVKGPSQ